MRTKFYILICLIFLGASCITEFEVKTYPIEWCVEFFVAKYHNSNRICLAGRIGNRSADSLHIRVYLNLYADEKCEKFIDSHSDGLYTKVDMISRTTGEPIVWLYPKCEGYALVISPWINCARSSGAN